MMKNRTPAYLFTADPASAGDMDMISTVRKTVSAMNTLSRQSVKYSGGIPKLFRICLKARLGKKNPAAAKYSKQWIQSIKLEDAQRIDVYIQERKDY